MNKWSIFGVAVLSAGASLAVPLVLIPEAGEVQTAIVVDGAVMDAKDHTKGLVNPALEREVQRMRLRDSVLDMAEVLRKMTGREVPVTTNGVPAGKTPILVGSMAKKAFGPVGISAPFKQGLRVVVDAKKGIGLYGESMLADSYAVYTFLDGLGCRWFMPGRLGECIPKRAELSIEESDRKEAPYTIYRGGGGYAWDWKGKGPFVRRNRMGGLKPPAGHCLENYVSKEDLEAHPEWLAEYEDGRPMSGRLKMSNKALAEHIGEVIAEKQKTEPSFCVCLSPKDGSRFDQSAADKALDAEDFDPSCQRISLTDRVVTFYNRIIERATQGAPDLHFSALAYVSYTRPPIRVKPHKNLVIYFAPITYSRAHPANMDEPNNKDLRYIIEGWGKASPAMAYYLYSWFLADSLTTAPFLRKWAYDIPFIYEKGACRYWMPETSGNNEFFFMACWMAQRMAWNPKQDPWKLYREANDRMFGAAADSMWKFWNAVDKCWVDTPEYSGAAWGHLARFTPERIAEASRHLAQAEKEVGDGIERERFQLAKTSWQLTTEFLQLRRDLAEGRWSDLETRSQGWKSKVTKAARASKEQYCFSWCFWHRSASGGVRHFDNFYDRTHTSAQYIATNTTLLVENPVRSFRFKAIEKGVEPDLAVSKPDYDDGAWPMTDVSCQTWSSLGYHNHMGSMWYRTKVDVKKAPAGKRVWLWIGATDGSIRAYVNGKAVQGFAEPKTPKEPKLVDKPSGYAVPIRFDVTDVVREGTNDIAFFASRDLGLCELGTGGLLSPVVFFAEK